MLIAQITDTHIVEKNNHWLGEPSTRTRERLIKVVAYLNELKAKPDVVLLTGDASDTGTAEAYRHLTEILQPLKMPLYLIPGNHDCRKEMRKAFSTRSYMPSEGFIHYAINEYPVRLIGLDTHVEGEDFGHICEKRFIWLSERLKEENEKPTLLFMHHPPVKTGHKVFDSINCLMPPHFDQLIKRQENIIGIITGHYHHLCITTYGAKLCFIAPSVAANHYFANPQEDAFVTALELEDPAVALHRWESGNGLTSHVVYLRDQNRRIDWSCIKNEKNAGNSS